MTIYIFKYNNYYNRIYKRLETLSEYEEQGEMIYYIRNANFNPNDGVSTSHIFGQNGIPSSDFQTYDGSGDYVIVLNDNNEIESRWFIIEARRKMAGQFELLLRRDLIADYNDIIVRAPIFIEKAVLSSTDPLIFNREDMSYNQIKTSEVSIVDSTNSAWLVGYMARNVNEDKEIRFTPNRPYDYGAQTLDEFEGYQYREDSTDLPRTYNKIRYMFTYMSSYGNAGASNNYALISLNGNLEGHGTINLRSSYYVQTPYDAGSMYAAFPNTYKKYYYNNPDGVPIFTNSNLEDINQYVNKIVRVGTADNYRYYSIRLSTKIKNNITEEILYNTYPEIYNAVYGNIPGISTSGANQGVYGKNDYVEYYLSFNDITDATEDEQVVTIPAARNHLEDAPYDMFCFPVSKIELGGITYNSTQFSLALAQEIFTKLTSSIVYDIQLLPFCPLQGIDSILNEGLTSLTEDKDYSLVKGRNDSITTIIFYPKLSSFHRIIPLTVDVPVNNIEMKVASECDVYRLCSPNYNGIFEFSAVRNNGVQYIEVNATYKPFTPFIHLNPNFGGLYGQDFNDNRGLICGGDFSIASVSSAWENYELQNKNYQKVFDRQIQNMEVQYQVQRINDIFAVGAGTAQGAMSGAMTGAMSSGGNPYAAAAGAVVGGVSSLAGGIADIVNNEKLRNEALDFTRDNFNYNLGNVKALPYSITKSSAFDINSKIFPFLEYYTATEEEKSALRDKIKYNGMTVRRIGKIEDYIRPNDVTYIKGQLIRLELDDEYHLVKEIAAELNKGVYI